MAWLMPSRGRVGNALRMYEVASDAPITLWLSADDPDLAAYQRESWPSAWTLEVGEKGLRLAQILNEFYRRHPDLPYYGFIGDDVVPETDGWWWMLRDAAGADRFVYPHDSIWGEKLCPHFCIGGDLVRAVGWLALPKLKHSYIDTAWWVLSGALGRRDYMPWARFWHRHPLDQGAEGDATYARGQQTYDWDKRVFEKWRERDAQADVARVLGKVGDSAGDPPVLPHTTHAYSLPTTPMGNLDE